MATPGFGFSVGDVLAGLHVVRKLIRALNDTAGSRAAYRKLIAELLTLEEALTGVQALQVVDPTQAAQKIALEQVAQQCQRSIEEFLNKNAKFKSSLGGAPRQSSSLLSAWRSNLHKVQWALCKESEIEGLRTEIAAHSTTLNLILSTIQLSTTKLQSEAIDECAQLAKVARDDGDETKALARKNNQLLTTQADLIVTISSAVTNLSSRQQTAELQALVQKVLESNMRIFNTVLQIQQLQASLPPQVDRQQPILFEDAHERLTPFHLEFINSFAAFQAVLEVRFSQVPGLKKVKGFEYALQDTALKRALDLSRPWESIFRPGRKVIMSMLFQQAKPTVSSCPGCLKEDVQNGDGDGGAHTQCSNPACGLWYRRVTEVKPIKRPRAEQRGRDSAKRRRVDAQTGHVAEEEDDEIRDFRRVQIVQEDREQTVGLPSTTTHSRASGQTQTPSDDGFLPLSHYAEQHRKSSPSRQMSSIHARSHEDTQSKEYDFFVSPVEWWDHASNGAIAQWESNASLPSKRLDRTMTDIYNDELYNPGPTITSASPSQPGQALRPPQRELFAQRLQAANDQHLSRNQSTSTTLRVHQRSSPFRHGSPLAPTPQHLAGTEANVRHDTAEETRKRVMPPRQEELRRDPFQIWAESDSTGTWQTLQPTLFSFDASAWGPTGVPNSGPRERLPPPLPPPRFVPTEGPLPPERPGAIERGASDHQWSIRRDRFDI